MDDVIFVVKLVLVVTVIALVCGVAIAMGRHTTGGR